MDRTTPPPFKKSLDFNLPTPEKIHAHGEREIWYLPSSVNEAIKIEVVFKAGKYYENFIGDAQFTLHLLDKGVEGKSAIEIANELDYYGSHLDLKVGYDFSTLSLYVLNKNIKKLLPLLISLIQKPSFPERELGLLKKQVSENLKVSLEKNEFVASNLIRKKVYGAHPYGRSTQLKDIEEVSLERVKRFYSEYFKPFKIFIVGKVDAEICKAIIQEIDLQSNSINLSLEIPDYKPEQSIVKGPGKSQASIRLGKRTISKKHSDWPYQQLANHILGGYFGSRLMKNIREEKGLTYGIHSAVQSMFHSSWLNISAEVNSSNADLALDEIRKELRLLDEIGVDELVMARNHFIGALQNDVTTIFAASERIKNLLLNGLPLDFYHNLIKQIDSIDNIRLTETNIRHFDPENFSSVVVK